MNFHLTSELSQDLLDCVYANATLRYVFYTVFRNFMKNLLDVKATSFTLEL
jgi:hypothetical protein